MTQTVLLAIETSTEFCSVALIAASAAAPVFTAPRIWFRHDETGAVSSMRVLPAVREVLDEAGFTLADCVAIAFGTGPGSFTGLRTATGIAQGLAFGRSLPVVPVGTLAACAEHARLNALDAGGSAPTRVLAALDARMDEVYWADYVWDEIAGDWRTQQPAALDTLGLRITPTEPFTLAGNAAAAFGERFPLVALAAHVDGAALPHAVPLAQLALRAFRADRVMPADQAVPEYVRNKVAQTTAERIAERAAREGGL
ncbi:MAG: tRNA threonylcarbamoyladenosine biosynthesis protein TsaB [Burkholderia gladioli]|nr:MAG: tRNA threonylcarbamoyladenosine biosynthesis protein TsaB [Burkholderia gladioli]